MIDPTPWVRKTVPAETLAGISAMSAGGRLVLSRRGPGGDFQARWVSGSVRGEARDADVVRAAVRAIRGGDDLSRVASADAVTGTE